MDEGDEDQEEGKALPLICRGPSGDTSQTSQDEPTLLGEDQQHAHLVTTLAAEVLITTQATMRVD